MPEDIKDLMSRLKSNTISIDEKKKLLDIIKENKMISSTEIDELLLELIADFRVKNSKLKVKETTYDEEAAFKNIITKVNAYKPPEAKEQFYDSFINTLLNYFKKPLFAAAVPLAIVLIIWISGIFPINDIGNNYTGIKGSSVTGNLPLEFYIQKIENGKIKVSRGITEDTISSDSTLIVKYTLPKAGYFYFARHDYLKNETELISPEVFTGLKAGFLQKGTYSLMSEGKPAAISMSGLKGPQFFCALLLHENVDKGYVLNIINKLSSDQLEKSDKEKILSGEFKISVKNNIK